MSTQYSQQTYSGYWVRPLPYDGYDQSWVHPWCQLSQGELKGSGQEVSHPDAELAGSGLGMSHTDVEMAEPALKASAAGACAAHLLSTDLLLLTHLAEGGTPTSACEIVTLGDLTLATEWGCWSGCMPEPP
ncbi:MAG: hypothetical protein FRX49_12268 [Trebouxia sp. A1-2]|nr:MAG: hypothetical protein FRX49_12268 [Trebouxia sp. A1-2]